MTPPKAVAQQLGIRPGDEIDWEIAGEALVYHEGADRTLSTATGTSATWCCIADPEGHTPELQPEIERQKRNLDEHVLPLG